MSTEQCGSLLIPIIMSCIPKEIKIQVGRKINERIWPIHEILDIILLEIESREISETITLAEKRSERTSTSAYRPRSPVGSTTAFVANSEKKKLLCYFCQQDHLSIDCKEIPNTAARKELLTKAKRCFRCMNKVHLAKTCSKKCRKRGGFHHQAICTKSSPESNETKGDKANPATDVTITATTTGKTAKVLLQTATTLAYGKDQTKRRRCEFYSMEAVSDLMSQKISRRSCHWKIKGRNSQHQYVWLESFRKKNV